MHSILTITRRELNGYFSSPLAYVFIVIFLALSGGMTFYLGGWLDRGRADLDTFFNWHPWLYLFLVPATPLGGRAAHGHHRVPDDPSGDHHRSRGWKIPGGLALYRDSALDDLSDVAHGQLSGQSR